MKEISVIEEYETKIFRLDLIFFTGCCTCAAITFAVLKLLGFYQGVSWIVIEAFIAINVVWDTLGIILIRNCVKDGVLNRKVYNLGKFYSLFAWCVLATALFLGGQKSRDSSEITFIWAAYQLFLTLLKASIIFLLLRVVARALPQLRQDQMTEFCWRVLTPVAIAMLIGELVWLSFISKGVAL